MSLEWERWASSVATRQPNKLINLKALKKFNEALDVIANKHDVPYSMRKSASRNHMFDITLIYIGGSPFYNHFKLTTAGDYIYQNPKLNLYKNWDIDENILSVYDDTKMNRYTQPDGIFQPDREYDLFLMQQLHNGKDATLAPKDEAITLDAIRYATETKTYTIFKAHPSTSVPNKVRWDMWEDNGLISEYTKYIDNCHLTDVIKYANRVYSANSAVSVNALVLGKPVATYRPIDVSEIVPTITTAYEMDNIFATSKEETMQFLTWYYHRLSINIDLDGFEDKIERIVQGNKLGLTTKELFK